MDVYNQHFGNEHTDIFHDDFYTKGEIVDAYSRYVSTIVKRYADEPSVLGTPLDQLLLWLYSPHFKAGNSPTTHAVPPACLRRRVARLRLLLDGLRPSQQL
jgi:hypothetical protein